MSKLKVPEGSESSHGAESVSSVPNKGRVMEAQPNVEGVTPDTPTGLGSTVHSQIRATGAALSNRVRKVNPEVSAGTHVVDAKPQPQAMSAKEKKAIDDAKAKLFSRGGSGNSDAVPYPGVSDRDFNSEDLNAPNT